MVPDTPRETVTGPAAVKVEATLDVIMGWNIMPGNAGGYDVVVMVVDINTPDGTETRCLTLASEDANRLSRDINSVAPTVRPMSKQIKTQGEG